MSEHAEIVLRDNSDLESLTLDELAAVVTVEVTKIGTYLSKAFDHAVIAGNALLLAKKLVPDGAWGSWIESNTNLSWSRATVYMRLAHYQDQIPAHARVSTIAAREYLLGLPYVNPSNIRGYGTEAREEAARLRSQGMQLRDISETVGASYAAVQRWLDPNGQQKNTARQQERREAKKALAEKEKTAARRRAADKAGDAISKAYSSLRLLAEALDVAILEADSRAKQSVLREARDLTYKAEDKIAEVLRVT